MKGVAKFSLFAKGVEAGQDACVGVITYGPGRCATTILLLVSGFVASSFGERNVFRRLCRRSGPSLHNF